MQMVKQNKSVLQRQYRNKEVDGFSLVRTEILHATRGVEDPKTRQDVLRKGVCIVEWGRETGWLVHPAARLIRELYILNTKLQHQLCNTRPVSETPPSYSYSRESESVICTSKHVLPTGINGIWLTTARSCARIIFPHILRMLGTRRCLPWHHHTTTRIRGIFHQRRLWTARHLHDIGKQGSNGYRLCIWSYHRPDEYGPMVPKSPALQL